jgi:hypothetical protein
MRNNYKINRKNLPNKSGQRFYNFSMLKVLPDILKFWNEPTQLRYFFDKPGMKRWYIHKIREAVFRADWMPVIICGIILLYRNKKGID